MTTTTSTTTTTPAVAVAPAASDQDRKWLVMLYAAGDDVVNGNSNSTISEYVQELVERWKHASEQGYALNNPNMTLVLFVDGLLETPVSQNGHMKVYSLINGDFQDETNDIIPQQNPNELIYINSGDDKILLRFVRWACKKFDANDNAYRMLSIIGHGGGWGPTYEGPIQPNGKGNGQPGWSGLCLDSRTGSSLSTQDLERLLRLMKHHLPNSNIHQGTPPIDVLFLDACLMGMIEVAFEIRNGASYLIAAPSQLWAFLRYEDYLNNQVLTHNTAPHELAMRITDLYNTDTLKRPFCIAALNLNKIQSVTQSIHILSNELQTWINSGIINGQEIVFDIYKRSQKYNYNSDSVSDADNEAHIDVYDFARKITESNAFSANVIQSAQNVMDKIGQRCKRVTYIDGIPSITYDTQLPYDPDTGPLVVWGHVCSTLSRHRRFTFHQAYQYENLSHAHGVAIYMPLGRRDCRPYVHLKNQVHIDHLHAMKAFLCGGYANSTRSELTALDPIEREQIRIDHRMRYYTGTELAFLSAPSDLSWNIQYGWEQFLDSLATWRMGDPDYGLEVNFSVTQLLTS